jgi:hypothetical protein
MSDVANIVVLVDADGRRGDSLDFKYTEFAILADGRRVRAANSSGGMP